MGGGGREPTRESRALNNYDCLITQVVKKKHQWSDSNRYGHSRTLGGSVCLANNPEKGHAGKLKIKIKTIQEMCLLGITNVMDAWPWVDLIIGL